MRLRAKRSLDDGGSPGVWPTDSGQRAKVVANVGRRRCGTVLTTDARILLDCRWLGVSGVGRVTELLLRGLHELQPRGRWILWGGDAVGATLWDGARHARDATSPRVRWGQAALLRVPPHDVALFMNQVRPLRPGRSVTLIHDTIPLRYAPRWRRPAFRAYYRLIARLSSRILTPSEFSRASIVRDLGVPSERIGVLRYPVDAALADRVRTIRAGAPRRDAVLYVGRFAPHKNVERLIGAFGRTRFAAAGGELLLVGDTPDARLRRLAGSRRSVTLAGPVEEQVIPTLYATCRLLVMPSLEEGFGLPVWEAMASGLPVCVSDGGALPATARGAAVPFPATSVDAMAAAIDASLARDAVCAAPDGPSLRDFAAQVVSELERVA